MTKAPEYLDPINDMPESLYISSSLRGNFNRNDQRPYDPETSRIHGLHLANAASEIIGTARSSSMILGYMGHQRSIGMPDDSEDGKNPAKWMKVKKDDLDGVFISERSGKNGLIGKKVTISFWSKYAEDGKTEDIDSGWIDYYGYGDHVWEMTLARSVAAMAVVLRDMEVDFQVRKVMLDKVTKEVNGKQKTIQPREVVDASPVFDAERDAALIAQNLDALIIAVEEGVDKAIEFLEDEDLYDLYYERAFGAPIPEPEED